MPAPYATRCRAGLKADSKQKARGPKEHVVKKQKKKGKAASADTTIDDIIADDAVLQGQQQVLGDLYQATFLSLRLDLLNCYSTSLTSHRYAALIEHDCVSCKALPDPI